MENSSFTELFSNFDPLKHHQNHLLKSSYDEFYSAAEDLLEACKLIETGFEYVTTFNSMMLFRKRK
jgi:hypothetical protein